MSEKTKVCFRKFREDNSIIALFPDEKWSDFYFKGVKYTNIASYQHIGQHGGASPELITGLPRATEKEYSDLYTELVSIGYNLDVIE